jgi:hypothetical protein
MTEVWTEEKASLERIKADLHYANINSNGWTSVVEDDRLDIMAGQILWAKQQMDEERLKGGYK